MQPSLTVSLLLAIPLFLEQGKKATVKQPSGSFDNSFAHCIAIGPDIVVDSSIVFILKFRLQNGV
nr:MAG TPA: hypothetical protein [Caudoviricetes sp.]